jgi:hypothetical protein
MERRGGRQKPDATPFEVGNPIQFSGSQNAC